MNTAQFGGLKHEITEKIDKMISKGHTTGNFGHLEYAQYMGHKLALKNMATSITARAGNTYTIDTPAIVSKHFHVEGVHNSTHRVLGKFL